MPADMIAHARRFSLWLSRQLDGGQIDVARLQPMLAQPLQPQDLAAFAPWADIAAAADEAAGETVAERASERGALSRRYHRCP